MPIYCIRCKEKTATINETKSGGRIKGGCAKCGCKKSCFQGRPDGKTGIQGKSEIKTRPATGERNPVLMRGKGVEEIEEFAHAVADEELNEIMDETIEMNPEAFDEYVNQVQSGGKCDDLDCHLARAYAANVRKRMGGKCGGNIIKMALRNLLDHLLYGREGAKRKAAERASKKAGVQVSFGKKAGGIKDLFRKSLPHIKQVVKGIMGAIGDKQIEQISKMTKKIGLNENDLRMLKGYIEEKAGGNIGNFFKTLWNVSPLGMAIKALSGGALKDMDLVDFMKGLEALKATPIGGKVIKLIGAVLDEHPEYMDALVRLSKRGAGGSILNKIIKKIPETHFRSIESMTNKKAWRNPSILKKGKYSYCGPGTDLDKRDIKGTVDPKTGLPMSRHWSEPINANDEACKIHDYAYGRHSDVKNRNIADREMVKALDKVLADPNERKLVKADAMVLKGIIGTKAKLGIGINGGARNRDPYKNSQYPANTMQHLGTGLIGPRRIMKKSKLGRPPKRKGRKRGRPKKPKKKEPRKIPVRKRGRKPLLKRDSVVPFSKELVARSYQDVAGILPNADQQNLKKVLGIDSVAAKKILRELLNARNETQIQEKARELQNLVMLQKIEEGQSLENARETTKKLVKEIVANMRPVPVPPKIPLPPTRPTPPFVPPALTPPVLPPQPPPPVPALSAMQQTDLQRAYDTAMGAPRGTVANVIPAMIDIAKVATVNLGIFNALAQMATNDLAGLTLARLTSNKLLKFLIFGVYMFNVASLNNYNMAGLRIFVRQFIDRLQQLRNSTTGRHKRTIAKFDNDLATLNVPVRTAFADNFDISPIEFKSIGQFT